MATHRIGILGPGTVPDTSGNVFFETYSVTDTATILDPLILNFSFSSTKDGVRGSFIVPQNYSGTAKIVIFWNANATTGDAIFDLSYLTRSDDEDMGAAATDTTDTVTTGTAGTAFLLNTSTITLTSGDFAASDVVTFELFRDQANASDTLAVDALVFAVLFEYADA